MESATPSAAKQLAGFIAKFDPDVASLARAARHTLRQRFPGAVELVYDNYNALAIGWGASERLSDAFLSLAVYAGGVNLYFLHGAAMPDPTGLLQGNGNRGRFIRLTDISLLDEPSVVALIETAVALAPSALPTNRKGHVVVKSVSAKQRPRRRVRP